MIFYCCLKSLISDILYFSQFFFYYFLGKWLACQSMDNQILIYNVLSRFRQNRKKVFKGHMVRKWLLLLL